MTGGTPREAETVTGPDERDAPVEERLAQGLASVINLALPPYRPDATSQTGSRSSRARQTAGPCREHQGDLDIAGDRTDLDRDALGGS